MSAKHRCKKCLHKPGPRRVTATVKEAKPAMRDITAARVHKKPCNCDCHGGPNVVA